MSYFDKNRILAHMSPLTLEVPVPRLKHRPVLVLASVAALTIPGAGIVQAAAAQPAADDPRRIGKLSTLFDEGFGKSPRCALEADGNVTCRPAAVSTAVLPDGRVVYWNGIDNTEQNVDTLVLLEAGRVLRDSQARLLDLSGNAPSFTELAPGTNGANPAGEYAVPLLENPGGTVGTGRPGDGLTGSIVGRVLPTDPVAPSADSAANDDDMFCSDLSQLPDGSILVAGGTDFYGTGAIVPEDVPGVGGMGVGELEGLRTTRVMDPETGVFTTVDPMKYGRWYPTLTTLPDGDVLTASGVTRLVANTQLSQVRRTETFDVQTRTWEENYTGPASENSLPMYPRMHLAPSGKVFYAAAGQLNGFGPTGYAADEALWGLYQLFDPQTDQWQVAGATQWAGLPRGGAFSTPLTLTAPYDRMDVLVGGGTLGPTPGSGIATSLSEVLTVGADDSVTPRVTEPMQNARWFSSGTLLPDGQVLASGGANLDHVIASGLESAVRPMELFDPETGEWTEVASLQRDRAYHNTATLLPDGRVLLGGHSPIMTGIVASHQDVGGAMANNEKDPSFEVYSPPYLHRGDRPVIRRAPAGIGYDGTFTVRTDDAADIESVRLIRTPTVSHTVDADQRGIDLPFAAKAGSLQVQAPPNGIVAPPGRYYLFINKKTGDGPVPSVAAIVQVGAEDVPGTAPIPGYDSAAVAANGAASPTEDSNILTGVLTRNFPAPGLEEILVDVLTAATPEQLDALLGGLTPAAQANLISTLSPAGLGNLLLDGLGSDLTVEQLSDQVWAAGGAPTTEVVQGVVSTSGEATAAVLTEVVSLLGEQYAAPPGSSG